MVINSFQGVWNTICCTYRVEMLFLSLMLCSGSPVVLVDIKDTKQRNH